MDYTNYKIASIDDKSEIRERLARMEEDLSKELNEPIVLIAYQKGQSNFNLV